MYCAWYELWSWYKNVARRKVFDKVLRDKAFANASNSKNYGYQNDLA